MAGGNRLNRHYHYAGATYLRPEIFVTNLFDHTYLLKGAFFSGESVGRPFMIQFRMSVGI